MRTTICQEFAKIDEEGNAVHATATRFTEIFQLLGAGIRFRL